MAYDSAHMLLAFGGGLPGGEQWSTNLRLNSTFNLTFAEQEGLVPDYDAAINGWFTSSAIMSPRASHQWTKFNQINIEGRYVFPGTSRVDHTPGDVGTGGGAVYPNQISLVATLSTAIQRGYANRGRMFLPIPGIALDTDGRISTGNQSACNTSVKALIDAVNAVVVLQRVHIMSNVPVDGAINEVTHVGVGRVLDTMRSRRTQLDEERTQVAVTPVP